MVNRGIEYQPGDPIYLLETVYPGRSKFKPVLSLTGLLSAIRAVEDDIKFQFITGPTGYRIHEVVQPRLRQVDPKRLFPKKDLNDGNLFQEVV